MNQDCNLNFSPLHDSLKSSDFGKDFVWGVATAATQIEGAASSYGKGESIWDAFCRKQGRVLHGDTPEEATDFYHRFEEDIRLMRTMNITNFRMSLSWSRILPQGTGVVNTEGVDFYHKIFDCCFQNGITPWVTLYHWDLPQALEARGGWTNRKILDWFGEYVTVCAENFGEKIRHWMVLNEPMVFTGAGYFLGIHAPGRKGIHSFLPAVHHAGLCQALGGRILRTLLSDAQIGTSFSCSHITPSSKKERDVGAAKRADALLNRLFLEPSLGMGYPFEDLPGLKRLQTYMSPGDEDNLRFDFDFVGLQNYTREVVKYSCFVPYIRAKIIPATNRGVETTQMDWEVYPEGMYHMIRQFDAYPGVKKILITENGAAFRDPVYNGQIRDTAREDYIRQYLGQVYRAKKEGCAVNGYFVWTFTDNFEWAEGYAPRFGLVYTDFETQQRIVKQSGHWYAHFLETRNKHQF